MFPEQNIVMLMYPVAVLLLVPLIYLGGYYARKLPEKYVYALAVVSLGLILLQVSNMYLPGAAFQFHPFPTLYAYVELFLAPSLGVLFLSISQGLLDAKRKRTAVRGLSLVLFMVLLVMSAYYPLTPYEALRCVVNEHGICHQSTGWSCGPAAGVTLLHGYGIKAGEEELARLGPANSVTGMGRFQLWNALHRTLKTQTELRNTQPIVKRVSIDELRDLPKPAAVVIDFSFTLDHWILLENGGSENIHYLDPLTGFPGDMPIDEFRDRWRGFAIYIKK